jgi:tight adherence protein B
VRIRLTLLVVAAGLCLLAPATAAAEGLRLTPVGHPRFPERTWILTLPAGRSVEPKRVHVKENGGPVADVAVSPASASGSKFGVVLVIDTSKSMAGRPIRDAVEAARALAARRESDQRLGVVTFNSRTSVLLPLTTDESAIERALAEPPALKPETHVYDGTNAAVSMLIRAKVAAGTVVVLSDGGDTGSRTTLPGTARRAREHGVRIFSVGLRTGSFEPDALRGLAEGAGGRYSEASKSADLAGIYDRLGAELSGEHLVQYRSLQAPRRHVEVEVTVDGVGQATADYRSPAVKLAPAPPFEKNDFWGSKLGLLVVSLVAGMLVATGLLAFIMRPERRRLHHRLAMFVSPPSERDDTAPARSGLGGRALLSAEQTLARMRWWPAFAEEVEIARITIPAVQIVALTAFGAVLLGWVLLAILGSVPLAVAAFIAVPFAVRAVIKQQLGRQRKLFAEQLADTLQVVASALRGGHSFIGALTVSVDEAPEPTRTEFERVLADEQIGIPLEQGLEVVARRMDCRDLEQVRVVATLQRETGGNTAEVLERVADTVRDRSELRRLISGLTAQGRLSRWIVTVLPVALIIAINVINPEYMKPLFETAAGNAMLVLAVILLTSGSLVIKRIVNIKV